MYIYIGEMLILFNQIFELSGIYWTNSNFFSSKNELESIEVTSKQSSTYSQLGSPSEPQNRETDLSDNFS